LIFQNFEEFETKYMLKKLKPETQIYVKTDNKNLGPRDLQNS
jgi:hypothetical protein